MELDDRLMLRSYDDLVSYLRRQGAAFAEVAAQHAVELPTRSPPVEGVLAIFWHPDLQLVQFIHPLPFEVSKERVSALESALHRINHAIVMPGFGFNHANATTYFRLVIPRQLDGAIPEVELQRAVTTVMITLRDFWHPLRAVIQEGAPPAGVLEAVRGHIA